MEQYVHFFCLSSEKWGGQKILPRETITRGRSCLSLILFKKAVFFSAIDLIANEGPAFSFLGSFLVVFRRHLSHLFIMRANVCSSALLGIIAIIFPIPTYSVKCVEPASHKIKP
ncbi:hypothetical protein ES703_50015 [subsurface metagenome]